MVTFVDEIMEFFREEHLGPNWATPPEKYGTEILMVDVRHDRRALRFFYSIVELVPGNLENLGS